MEPHIPFFLSNAGTSTGSTAAHLEFQRAQFQEYAQRLQMGIRTFPGHYQGLNSLAYQGHLINPYFHPYLCKDPRTRYVHEEPKPNHSYIGKYEGMSWFVCLAQVSYSQNSMAKTHLKN